MAFVSTRIASTCQIGVLDPIPRTQHRPITTRSPVTAAHCPFRRRFFFSFFFSAGQRSVFRRIDALLGEFTVGGGVHDSYTFQCGLVGYFTSPGIDTRWKGPTAFSVSSERHWQSGVNGIAKVPKRTVFRSGIRTPDRPVASPTL